MHNFNQNQRINIYIKNNKILLFPLKMNKVQSEKILILHKVHCTF